MKPSIEAAAAFLTERLGDIVQRDVPLGPMTTYRVGGPAAIFVDADRVEALVAVGQAAATYRVPVIVIGRGSNMLVADQGFGGIALSVAALGNQIEFDHATAIATFGGGVALPVAARRSVAESLTGFEWAVGVPGSIGGAVRMNAGGHGSDMATSLLDVDVFDHAQPDVGLRTLTADTLKLRFRASSLSPSAIVVAARLQLAPGNQQDSAAMLKAIVKWRRDHQPGGQNCGSVFVNPVPGEVTCGSLIEGVGLSGFAIGTAQVSEMHSNFIQASPGGSAADVRAVMETVRARVAAETGYCLRSEVRLVGFDDTDPLLFEEAT